MLTIKCDDMYSTECMSCTRNYIF